MPDPLPTADSRPGWFARLDGLVLDMHRSGFLSSLIVHLVVLLSLATCCLGTDPAARRVAVVVAFEGSGAEGLDEQRLDLGAIADGGPDAAVAAAPVDAEDGVEPAVAAAPSFDGLLEARDEGVVAAEGWRAAAADAGVGLGRGASRGAGAGAATFFGIEAKGREFVYLVDFSGSMEGPRIEQARYELRRSIDSLPVEASFLIILFNHGSVTMPAHGLVRATDDNKERFLDWVDRQSVGGGTNPIDALIAAIRRKPDAIFLLTDGQFADPLATVRLVSRTRGPVFHTVAFHDNASEEVLRRIARIGRGSYRFQSP